MIRVLTVETPELGDRSYLVHDGTVAVVVDPQRDVDRVLTAASDHDLEIVAVAETHIHNDYVSGGLALAELLTIPYLVAAAEHVTFAHRSVSDGDRVPIADGFSIGVVATPGHTEHHVSYVAYDGEEPVLACTGGSLLYGSVGRTDLSGTDRTEPLARAQYRSAQRLSRLPDAVIVLPTHGFGSFCAPGLGAWTGDLTLGQQKLHNLAFQVADEDGFVPALLRALIPYPRYYEHMAAVNRAGAPYPDLLPPPSLGFEDLDRIAGQGTWLVDLRPRAAFAARHLRSSVNFEHGPSFTTWMGSVVPWGTPIALMGDTDVVVGAAQRDLARIGIEHLVGSYVGHVSTAEAEACSYPMVTGPDLLAALHHPSVVTLDVRRQDEWDAGHLPGATHIPLAELLERLDELPPGTYWIHCAAGYRASIAASLLHRIGRSVVLVDGSVVPHLQPA